MIRGYIGGCDQRETQCYEPFALHPPIQWAIKGMRSEPCADTVGFEYLLLDATLPELIQPVCSLHSTSRVPQIRSASLEGGTSGLFTITHLLFTSPDWRRVVSGNGAILRFDQLGVLLPNNQRQHRTLHIQKDVLPCALH